jgi:hypothetical protein
VKVLVTIPHFFNPAGGGAYGSTGPETDRRAAVLGRTLTGLHQTFGPRQAFLLCLEKESQPETGCNGKLARVNRQAAAQVDVVVCTAGNKHLLDKIPRLHPLFRHQPLECDPMLLGFGCHRMLRSALGRYDYYCYLEDDLWIHDTQFLQKVSWFSAQFGDETVLFPHRYEVSGVEPLHKLYIDGPVRADFTARWQDVADRRLLRTELMGQPLNFVRWANPHSGCFFLNARQMAHWVASPEFSSIDCSFAGPLESAASLGIMKHFRIYKPAAENAGFLELQHQHARYLGHSLQFSSAASQKGGNSVP